MSNETAHARDYVPPLAEGTVVFCHRCHARYTAEGGIPYMWNGLMQQHIATCSVPNCGGTCIKMPPPEDCVCSQCRVERRAPDSPMREADKLIPRGVEAVDHPSHYGGKDDPFETIKVLRAWLDRLKFTPYQAGLYFNVVKYLSRAGLKGALLEDLKKADFYLKELIRVVEESDASGAIIERIAI